MTPTELLRAFAVSLCLAATPPATGAAVGQSPVEVMDDAGAQVRLPRPAARVISLVPSLTETVEALAPEALVARTRYDRTHSLTRLPSVGGTLRPDLELLVQLRPDLVVAWHDPAHRQLVRRIEALHVPVYLAEIETIDDFRRHVGRLGLLVGRPERAAVLVDSLDSVLQRVSDAVADRRPVDVYYSLWHHPPQTTGPGTFIDELIRYAGGRNVFDDAPVAWPTISLEEIVTRDPEVLVIAREGGGRGDPSWLRGPGWRELSAITDGRFVVVDADLFNRPGPRLTEAVALLARFLHGDAVMEGAGR